MGQLALLSVSGVVRAFSAIAFLLPVVAVADGAAGPAHSQGAAEAATVAPPRSPKRMVSSRTWAPHVSASYRVAFNGFDVGRFNFQSSIKGASYSLQGHAELSALLGAFQWSGMTRTSGKLSGDNPRPAGYGFDFSGTGRSGSVKMGFAGNAITSLSVYPTMPPLPGTLPVKDSHLKDVLDPLSAVIALSRGNLDNPCARRLSIFDGKQRFDLVLSPKGIERVGEARPGSQPDIVHVCRIRYVPIAGFAPSDEVQAMSRAAIEVSLRPVPSANLLVPHQITIPTSAGTATLTAERVSITTPAQTYIALVN
jgi:hypothetical protein